MYCSLLVVPLLCQVHGAPASVPALDVHELHKKTVDTNLHVASTFDIIILCVVVTLGDTSKE